VDFFRLIFVRLRGSTGFGLGLDQLDRRHEQSRHPTRAKDAEILREIRDADSRLATLFVRDWR
jgi:hypothetical protein